MEDVMVLQFLQNKLNLETSAVRQEYGFAAEKQNPTTFVSLTFDEILALQELVNERLKNMKLDA